MLYINLFKDGGILLEDVPAGDQSVSIKLGEREMKCLNSLLALESYEVAQALGSLFAAGVQAAHRANLSLTG
jgi:hypothetical protein